MAYDVAAGNIVLFGGMDSNGVFLNDTWAWDGTTWTQQFPPVSPPARRWDLQGMTYDGATRTVMFFGGVENSSYDVFGDTWTWDGSAKTWTQQFPSSSPSPRRAPIAYDAATKTVVLFGGDATGLQFNDTWTWDGTTWTQRFPSSAPSARTDATMAYDATLATVVLFGGFAGDWENSLDDTWRWDGIRWKQINPATIPPNRYAFGMEYDPLAKGVLMFGGFSSTVGRDDTWVLTQVP